MSQDAVAAAFGVDRRYVSRWENGDTEPYGLALMRYLSAVGARVEPAAPEELQYRENYYAGLEALRREAALADQGSDTQEEEETA